MYVIAAFPGTGRHDYVKTYPNIAFVNPPIWQPGYVTRQALWTVEDALYYRTRRAQYTLLTPWRRVLDDLHSLNLEYALVMPDPSLKDEYYERILNTPGLEGGELFANYIRAGWDYQMYDLQKKARPRVTIVLQSGEYIKDRLPFHQNPDYLINYRGINNTDIACAG